MVAITKHSDLLKIWTDIDLLSEPWLLVATQENVPAAPKGTFIHCSVEISLDGVVVMVIELLLLRGSPLYIHSSVGEGTPSKLHHRAKVLPTSNISMGVLEVFTSGASSIVRR